MFGDIPEVKYLYLSMHYCALLSILVNTNTDVKLNLNYTNIIFLSSAHTIDILLMKILDTIILCQIMYQVPLEELVKLVL